MNNELSDVETSGERLEPHNLSEGSRASEEASTPSRPASPTKLKHSKALHDALLKLKNYKLRKLHYSLTKLSAKDHSPLLYVGLWSLIECLTALDGRNPRTDFVTYLNPQRLEGLGLGDKYKTSSLREALKRISAFGNGTKHDGEAAGFNHEQLINDFQVAEKAIKKLVKSCIDKMDD